MTTTMNTAKKRNRNNKGFSLVEMALAMGVVGFAMVSLLGLMPVGLNIARDTMDLTVRSQIVQLITNDLQLTEYDKLSEWSGETLKFNLQGLPETEDGKTVFSVAVDVQNGSVANAAIDDGTAKVVQLKIYKAQREQPIYETSFLIANTGDHS